MDKISFTNRSPLLSRSKIQALFLFGSFIGASLLCVAQGPVPAKSLLALSKTDHTLAIIDPVTYKVIARVPVGQDPHEVIASTDGKTAYVSIYGGGSLHELNIIDLVAQQPLVNVDTRPLLGPHGLAFAHGKAWFTAEGSKSIGSYDPATGKIDWVMGTGQDRTHMIYVTPDGKTIYTTNVSSGTVSILSDTLIQPGRMGPPNQPERMGPPNAPNQPEKIPPPGAPNQPGRMGPPNGGPHEDWTEIVIPTAKGSEGFDVSPDGSQLWTAASEDGTITIIDLRAKKWEARIDGKVLGANRLKFTPDGKRVLITSLRDGQLFIFDVASHKEVKRLSTGHGAAGILMDPDGTRAFIGCTGDNYIAVIDLKKLEVVAHIDAGGGPDGLAWAIRQ